MIVKIHLACLRIMRIHTGMKNQKVPEQLKKLVEPRGSLTQLARLAGVSPQLLSNVVTGLRRATWNLIEKIYRATNGAITPNDWLIN